MTCSRIILLTNVLDYELLKFFNLIKVSLGDFSVNELEQLCVLCGVFVYSALLHGVYILPP
jgi:hypothetical protein